MSEFYVITENFMNNRSSIITNDRSEYYCDLDFPHVSVGEIIKTEEESSVRATRDFHLIGEMICQESISKILSKYNPYKCRFFPISINDDKNGSLSDFSLISVENIISCADMEKSEIFVFPKRKNHIKILSLYLDLDLLRKVPKYKRNILIIEEAKDIILVSKDIGEELLSYLSKNNDSSLVVKPVSEDGQVPGIF